MSGPSSRTLTCPWCSLCSVLLRGVAWLVLKCVQCGTIFVVTSATHHVLSIHPTDTRPRSPLTICHVTHPYLPPPTYGFSTSSPQYTTSNTPPPTHHHHRRLTARRPASHRPVLQPPDLFARIPGDAAPLELPHDRAEEPDDAGRALGARRGVRTVALCRCWASLLCVVAVHVGAVLPYIV